MPNIPSSYTILFFTVDFAYTTRLIHNWVLFLLCLSLFVPSEAFSLLFSSSIWTCTDLGGSSFSVISFSVRYHMTQQFIFQYHISYNSNNLISRNLLMRNENTYSQRLVSEFLFVVSTLLLVAYANNRQNAKALY